jgi:hypothetical protein
MSSLQMSMITLTQQPLVSSMVLAHRALCCSARHSWVLKGMAWLAGSCTIANISFGIWARCLPYTWGLSPGRHRLTPNRLQGHPLVRFCAPSEQSPSTETVERPVACYTALHLMITNACMRQVEGAMIPRQCQAGTIVQPRSTEDVANAIKEYTQKCKAAGGK